MNRELLRLVTPLYYQQPFRPAPEPDGWWLDDHLDSTECILTIGFGVILFHFVFISLSLLLIRLYRAITL